MHIRGYWTRTLLTSSSTGGHYHHSTTTSVYPPPPPSSSSSCSTSVSTTTGPASSTTTIVPTSTGLPTQPTSNTMPLITSIITTSVLTVTTLITPTASSPPPQTDIIGPIEGLPQCAQTIIFERLANSQCNPANFPCICDELVRLRVGEEIRRGCSASDAAQYESFFGSICPNVRRPSTTITPVNSTTAAPVILSTGTGISNATNSTSGPFSNTTIPTGTGTPVTLTTSEVVIPTTGANGEPSSVTSQVVGPVGPGGPGQPGAPTGPSGPEFTGSAAAVEAPEMFGFTRAALMAGAIGIMGLVFAEL